MQIAMASGKGGTGKTTLATNLARVAQDMGRRVAYLDCDVEEPNGHIFMSPQIIAERPITKQIPQVDAERCTHCGECGEICQYNAIISFRAGPAMVFADLCHACGGCTLVCPSEAIREQPRPMGRLRIGDADGVQFLDGTLDIGQHMGPPVIREVKQAAPECDLRIIDAPPGASCPAVEAVRGSDLVVLVTEPTPFGLHDLKLTIEMLRMLQLPLGVVINRAERDRDLVSIYCQQARVPVFGELPDDRAVAEAYSRGRLACVAVPGYRRRIEEIYQNIVSMVESP
jgi:MinD superfamily P-loop ATPase